jgi:hypothetical protein
MYLHVAQAALMLPTAHISRPLRSGVHECDAGCSPGYPEGPDILDRCLGSWLAEDPGGFGVLR